MTELIAVTIRDSVLYEPVTAEQLTTLFFPKRVITARELIGERVRREVEAYNQHKPLVLKSLVTPGETEQLLNGPQKPKQHMIDAEKQVRLAVAAFSQNAFILLVNERQVSELDQEIELTKATQVVFLKLMPLVGG